MAPVVFRAGDNRSRSQEHSLARSMAGLATKRSWYWAAVPRCRSHQLHRERRGVRHDHRPCNNANNASLLNVYMSGSRLIDLSESAIHAVQIAVRWGATFGSAGSVIGNIAFAGHDDIDRQRFARKRISVAV